MTGIWSGSLRRGFGLPSVHGHQTPAVILTVHFLLLILRSGIFFAFGVSGTGVGGPKAFYEQEVHDVYRLFEGTNTQSN